MSEQLRRLVEGLAISAQWTDDEHYPPPQWAAPEGVTLLPGAGGDGNPGPGPDPDPEPGPNPADDLVFLSFSAPYESRELKGDLLKPLNWPYAAPDPRPAAIERPDGAFEYRVVGGMKINVTDGAQQWSNVLQWGKSVLGDAPEGRALGTPDGLGVLQMIAAKDKPELGSNLEALFQGQPLFTGQGIEGWDTSGVTRMGRMFTDCYMFNGDISKWDVSSVTDFASMFLRARSFNRNISGWDVGGVVPELKNECFDPETGSYQCNVTGMGAMFYGATAFDQDLSGWNVGVFAATEGAIRNDMIAFGGTREAGKEGVQAVPFSNSQSWAAEKQPQFLNPPAVVAKAKTAKKTSRKKK